MKRQEEGGEGALGIEVLVDNKSGMLVEDRVQTVTELRQSGNKASRQVCMAGGVGEGEAATTGAGSLPAFVP